MGYQKSIQVQYDIKPHPTPTLSHTTAVLANVFGCNNIPKQDNC
jgi:hypothetical protein